MGNYKWKPSAAAKKAFAEKMKDPEEEKAYHIRKEAKAEKRRQGSNFDYKTAGGYFVPTKQQHDFCLNNWHLFLTDREQDAKNFVLSGYSLNEKIHHDFIHIVNEKIRTNNFISL